jgi:hypothetical protein
MSPSVADLTLAVPGLEVHLTVPFEHEQAVQKPGYVKCLLWFETDQPFMTTSRLLQAEPFEIDGPAMEFVAILKPAEQTFDLGWAFLEDFEKLKDQGIIPPDARMGSFDFMEEDRRFLAWVM